MCHSLEPDPAPADLECREEPALPSPRIEPMGAPDTCVVRLAGDLDASARPSLERALAPFLDGAPLKRLLLDLSAITAVDSGGLGLLVRAQAALRKRGIDLVLWRCSATVRRALTATCLIELLELLP
jgi:anti-sigma B factor antagonist